MHYFILLCAYFICLETCVTAAVDDVPDENLLDANPQQDSDLLKKTISRKMMETEVYKAMRKMKKANKTKEIVRCTDRYRFCHRVSNHCTNTKRFPSMENICSKTCNRCPKENYCRDRLPDSWCSYWTNHCKYSYVSFVCPKSCNLCSCPDLVFLVDGSLTRNRSSFDAQMQFLKNLTSSIDLETYNVGMVLLEETVQVQFGLQKHHTVHDLHVEIGNTQLPDSSSPIQEGLRFVINAMIRSSSRFTLPCSKRTVLLLCDKRSMQQRNFEEESRLLETFDINLTVVSVGKQVPMPQSLRTSSHYNFPNFEELTHPKSIRMVARTC